MGLPARNRRDASMATEAPSSRALWQVREIEAALNDLPERITVMDGSDEVLFANRAAVAMFRALEREIREERPDFRADELVGQSLATGAPASAGPIARSSAFRMGDAFFRVTVRPVLNEDGSSAGSVIEWEDVGEEAERDDRLWSLFRAA